MFVSKAGAYPSEVPFMCYGMLMAVPANIRLSWRGFPGRNVLAYNEKALLTAVKIFITLGHSLYYIKLGRKDLLGTNTVEQIVSYEDIEVS